MGEVVLVVLVVVVLLVIIAVAGVVEVIKVALMEDVVEVVEDVEDQILSPTMDADIKASKAIIKIRKYFFLLLLLSPFV